MALWRPFSSERRARIAGLLSDGARSLDDFAVLRRALSGADVSLAALPALIRDEPGLAARLGERILPAIVRYARALALREPVLSVHEAGRPARTVLPRAESARWIAHMFLGTLEAPAGDHPHVDFAPLLAAEWPWETAKVRCVLAWFDRIADAPPTGRIEIERVVATPPSVAAWEADASPLLPLEVRDEGAIEDAPGHRQVDFANMYLGGGVLSGGCVQEEIRFAVSPELFVGMLVSPRMRDDEAIILRGAERYARTSGYARTVRYAGPWEDPTERASDGTPDIELVAIDAVDYARRDSAAQFTEAAILRELGKARAGFLRDERRLPVATGNWGCGAFRGDPPLKAVIQWLAASAEGRALTYYPFGDERVGDLAGFGTRARGRLGTVGALFRKLMEVRKDGGSGSGLYRRLVA